MAKKSYANVFLTPNNLEQHVNGRWNSRITRKKAHELLTRWEPEIENELRKLAWHLMAIKYDQVRGTEKGCPPLPKNYQDSGIEGKKPA